MSTERRTKVLADRSDAARSGFDLAAILQSRERLLRLLLCMALGSTAVAFLAILVIAGLAARSAQFVVLDPGGNTIVAPGASFSEAKEVHVQQALLIASALLTRNAQDFDQPEVLRAICSREALAQVAELKAAEAREFSTREMEQKPRINRIDALATRQGDVQMKVVGEVARFGYLQQSPFVETLPFTLVLDLQFNADILRNRRQPTILRHFTLTYETPRKP